VIEGYFLSGLKETVPSPARKPHNMAFADFFSLLFRTLTNFSWYFFHRILEPFFNVAH